MQVKEAYQSKTIAVNAVMLIVYCLQIKYGFVIPAEQQAAAVALLNVGLRFISEARIRNPLNGE